MGAPGVPQPENKRQAVRATAGADKLNLRAECIALSVYWSGWGRCGESDARSRMLASGAFSQMETAGKRRQVG
jgi:hypothetical protein